MTERVCVVCPQLRPGEPRQYERPNVCEGCRARLHAMLTEITELYADLRLEKGSGGGAKVSGSRTPPLPLAVTALDLTLAPRGTGVSDDLVPLYERRETTVEVYDRATAGQRCVCDRCEQARAEARKAGKPDPTQPFIAPTEAQLVKVTLSQRQRKRDANGWLAYGPSGDQVGDVSVPAALDSWARDWQSYAWATLPTPAVSSLTRWLLDRLDWACDSYPAIDDFAAEMANVLRGLRRVHGLAGPRVELLDAPCRRCDWMTLVPVPHQDRIECLHCGDLATGDEYERWTGLLAHGVQELTVDFDLDVLLYVDEAALLAKVSQHVIRQWIRRGLLPVAERDHGRPRFTARAVLAVEHRTRTGIVAA